MRILILFFGLVFIGGSISCTSSNASEDLSEGELSVKDSIPADTVQVIEPEPFKMSYSFVFPMDSINNLDSFSEEEIQTILVVNRIDRKYLMSKDSIILPDSLSTDLDLYCPFPLQVDSLEKFNKIIYVSRFAQAFAVYEKGERKKWGPVSTGKKATETPNGLYNTNWKRKVNISSVNSSWILNWSFNISNYSGISFHEYALPGRPASHSCVRMYAKDAEWVYYWADQWIMGANERIDAYGTPVVIFGEYTYDGGRPWLLQVNNPDALKISEEMLLQETEPHIEMISKRQKTRMYVLKKIELEKELEEKEELVI